MKKIISMFLTCAIVLTSIAFLFPTQAKAAGEPESYVEITVAADDPYITINIDGGLDTSKAKYAVIYYKGETGTAAEGQIFPNPPVGPNVHINYEMNGNWNKTVVDLSELAGEDWSAGFRFDPLCYNDDAEVIDIAWIAFTATNPGADFDENSSSVYKLVDYMAIYEAGTASSGVNALMNIEVKGADKVVNKDKVVNFAIARGTGDPKNMTGVQMGFGAKLTVPEGYKLKDFVILQSPTWATTDASTCNALVYVYKWDTDFETTIEGTALDEIEIPSHEDNKDLVITFGTELTAGTYLINVISTGENPLGMWDGVLAPGMEEYEFQAFWDGLDVEWVPQSKFTLTSLSGEGGNGGSDNNGGNGGTGNNGGSGNNGGTGSSGSTDNTNTADTMPIAIMIAAAALAATVILKKRRTEV